MSLSRRTLARNAVWATPVLLVGAVAPVAAASGGGPAPNSDSNYYWSAESQGHFTHLEPAAGHLDFNYSTQISYRADPYVAPPEKACLQVTITFDQPVTLQLLVTTGWDLLSPADNGPATTFVVQACPSGQGGGLSMELIGSQEGPITATSTMTLINGGSTTWSDVEDTASTDLIAGPMLA